MAIEKSVHHSIHRKLRDHGSAPRVDTELTMLEFIKEVHADYHVTRVQSEFDIAGFAAAGLAELTLHTDDDTWTCSTRYRAPNVRLSAGDGTFYDDPHFARYSCRWNHVDFVIYHVKYREMDETYTGTYVLSPTEGQTIDAQGHSPVSDALIRAVGAWSVALHSEMYVFDNNWSKNASLFQSVQKASWEDVILDPNMKSSIASDVRSFFENRDVYQEFNVPWKRGIIMHGTPGNGKSISIKALLNEFSTRSEDPIPGLYVKSLKSSSGKESSVRNIFQLARNMAPCILVFDDLDSLVSEDVRTYFLNEVDGLMDNDGILMIGSTNHLDKLDPALAKRPSRFDRKYAFDLPGRSERRLYAELWQRKLDTNRHISFNEEAIQFAIDATEGFSFAYMKELFITSLLVTIGNSADQIEVVSDQEANNGGGSAKGPQFQLELPKSLKDNKFVEALFRQARVLRREMNSVDDSAKSKNKATSEEDEEDEED